MCEVWLMFLSVQLSVVFTNVVVLPCFYFEVWCHPCVPVRFPDRVNLFHLCLVVFPPYCLFEPRPLSRLGRITCRFCQCSSLLFFPEWFLVCCLLYSTDTRELPARHLYLCCVSWFPGFDFCFIEQLWSSVTHQFCLFVHALVLNGIALTQNHNLVFFMVACLFFHVHFFKLYANNWT